MRSPEIAPIDYRRHNKQIDSEYLDSNQIVLDSVKSIRDKFVCFQKEVLQKEKDKVALKEPLNMGSSFVVKDDSKENLKDYLKNRINGAYLKRERDIPDLPEVKLAA